MTVCKTVQTRRIGQRRVRSSDPNDRTVGPRDTPAARGNGQGLLSVWMARQRSNELDCYWLRRAEPSWPFD